MTIQPRRGVVTVDLSLNYTTELGRRLDRLAIKRAHLAREMGINPEQVSRLISQLRDPRISTVIAVEQAIARLQKKAGRESR